MYVLISCALEDRLRRADTAFLGSQHISPSSKPYRLAGIGPFVVSCASVIPSSDVRTGCLSSSDYRNGLRRGRPRGEMRYWAVETIPGCLLADEMPAPRVVASIMDRPRWRPCHFSLPGRSSTHSRRGSSPKSPSAPGRSSKGLRRGVEAHARAFGGAVPGVPEFHARRAGRGRRERVLGREVRVGRPGRLGARGVGRRAVRGVLVRSSDFDS